MIFNPRNDFGRRVGVARKIIKIVILGCILVAIFLFFGKKLSGRALTIFAPALKLYDLTANSISGGLNILEPQYFLVDENNALKREVSDLQIKNSELLSNNVANDNKDTEPGRLSTLAISFPPQTPFDTIVIEKGAKDGLKEGDKIYLSRQILVGSVEIVYDSYARVRLLTSPGQKTEAVLSRTGDVVVLVGYGGGSFKLILPISFDVKEGDLIVLPGSAHTIVGQVKSIKRDETSSFLTLLISLPIKIDGNTTLYVQI